MMLSLVAAGSESSPSEKWFGVAFLGVVGAFLCYRSLRNSADRRTLIIKWACSLVLFLMYFAIASLHDIKYALLYILPSVLLAFIWLPSLTGLILKPITESFEGGGGEAEEKPFYFIAEANRRKGLYQEAAAAVRAQLEKFPGDAEGMMRLAAIQAEDLHDLPAATETLNQLLDQSGLPAGKAAGALQALADWQMNLGRDAAAARRSFERLIEMFPGSPIALSAQQRIAHLEGAAEAREFREHAVFKVPSREKGLRPAALAEPVSEADAAGRAAEYVRQLEKHPNDTEAREKLALLYAEELARLDLAVDQLEQLAALRNATPKQAAHWLELLATLHIRHGSDLPSAQNALRRIVERFPKSAAATRATTRLATLQGELKSVTTSAAAKPLGAYEKDLGLKRGPYPQS
ncbi:MAG TPA: tetratricopeptide repeat protein [Verrucomicrobiae bacterium]|jgi:tetratricopeptide (TPR) repeat protein